MGFLEGQIHVWEGLGGSASGWHIVSDVFIQGGEL